MPLHHYLIEKLNLSRSNLILTPVYISIYLYKTCQLHFPLLVPQARHETLVSPRAIQKQTRDQWALWHVTLLSVSISDIDISYRNRKWYCYPNPLEGAFHLNVPTAFRWVAVETGRIYTLNIIQWLFTHDIPLSFDRLWKNVFSP